MKTTRGIELDINKSDITFKIEGLNFYFTSILNKKRFEARYKEFIEAENLKFKIKYNIEVDLKYIFLISLYKKIEKRGFKVYNINQTRYLNENEKFIL